LLLGWGCIIFALSSTFFCVGFSDILVEQVRRDIQKNIDAAALAGYRIDLYDLAMDKLPHHKEITEASNGYFRSPSRGDICYETPSETLQSYILELERTQLSEFFTSGFLDVYPEPVKAELELLRFMQNETSIFTAFTTVPEDAGKFVTGFVFLKAYRAAESIQCLFLAAYIELEIPSGCSYGQHDNNQYFEDMAKHFQDRMIITAAVQETEVGHFKAFHRAYSNRSRFNRTEV
jgi:hypothetical protein